MNGELDHIRDDVYVLARTTTGYLMCVLTDISRMQVSRNLLTGAVTFR